MKYHILMETAFHYNGNGHYIQSNGGLVRKIFKVKADAIKESMRLNARDFGGLSIQSFVPDDDYPRWTGFYKEDLITKINEIIHPLEIDPILVTIPPNVSIEKLSKLSLLLERIRFYYVEDVEGKEDE